MNSIRVLVLSVLCGALYTTAAAAHGAKLYQPCKACHLASGKGVPGAFPPLGAQIVALASRDDGRAYLPLVIKRGMIGVLEIHGKRYRGAMPARTQYDAADVAELLNYILSDLVGKGGADVTPFTQKEVQASFNAHPKVRGSAVLAMRPDLSKPMPDLSQSVTDSSKSVDVSAPAKSSVPEATPKFTKKAAALEDPTKKQWADHLNSVAAGKQDDKGE